MEQIQKDQHKNDNHLRFIALIALSVLSLMVSSCSAIAEIFKAGMGFGIFIVVVVLAIIIFFIIRLRKK